MAIGLPKNPWLVFLLGVLFAQFVLPMIIGFVATARSSGSAPAKNGK